MPSIMVLGIGLIVLMRFNRPSMIFITLLGSCMESRSGVKEEIMNQGPRLSADNIALLDCNFTHADVKRVIFSIPDDKSPGLGYNSFFFKESWDIIGSEISEAVLDFFKTGKILKELNVT